MKKRLISLLVALCMAVTLLPVSAITAWAEEGGSNLKPLQIQSGYPVLVGITPTPNPDGHNIYTGDGWSYDDTAKVLTITPENPTTYDLTGRGSIRQDYSIILCSAIIGENATIENGDFGDIRNPGSSITNYGTITSGVYSMPVVNHGIITGGTFSSTVTNNGTIKGGIFREKPTGGTVHIGYTLNVNFPENGSYECIDAGINYFGNSGYRMNNKMNSVVAELNSRLGDNLYNELRASGTFVRDFRDTEYAGPCVQISNVTGGDGETKITANIGTEFSSGANKLNQDVYSFEDNLSWYLGNHTLTFGTHNEIYKISNLFIQASEGAWYYNSLDHFMQDKPYKFTYKYSDPDMTGGNLKYAPVMKAGQFGFYAQDKWVVSRDFNFTYGIRFDIPLLFNKPTVNPTFNDFAAGRNMGVRVGETPSAKLMVSPRVGFSWYTDEEHRTLIRGGVGIFTGRVPFVWLSNSFNNTGMEQKGTTLQPKDESGKNDTNEAPSLGEYKDNPLAAATGSMKQDIVTTDKKFKYPQVLRANLAWEQFLPGDVKMTLEGVYSKTMNNVFFENLALVENGQVYAVPGVEASASPSYKVQAGDYYSIINLKNTNKGYSYALSALLEKHFGFGLDMSASYTFGHSKSVNDGTSSVAYSNWKYNYSRDTNSGNELGFSKFDIPHRVMAQVAYTTPKYWNNWMSTSISVIYNGFSGNRYSLTMNETSDFNGDGQKGNSLLYIPTDEELNKMKFVDATNKKGEVTMTAEESRQAFKQWIEGDAYAKEHRGQYAERNSNLTKWEHEINLHLAQTIYNPKGLGKLEFTFDIINFANMLNKKWGATYGSLYNLSPISVTKLTTVDGQTTPNYIYNKSEITKSDVSSRWHAQVGIRLTF